jgi:acetoin:2,6-dichlorophenolindophenol oxidoreductase subunit beta
MLMLEAINGALHALMKQDEDLHVVGEDLLDPYGGAFKVTKGLSTLYPERVLTTPISEAALMGFATGMAMKGKPCVVEVMFGDFLVLGADQIINHMSKLPWVYNHQVEAPVIVRAPMGGKRGYGSTHSQSLEKHFCGVPGLDVVALSQYGDVAGAYHEAHAGRRPTLIIENKMLYARKLKDEAALTRSSRPDLVFVTYGGSVEVCDEAAQRLADEEEITANVIEVRQLSPFPAKWLRERVGACAKVVTVEEGVGGWGFASEVARALVGKPMSFAEVSAPPHPIPSSRDWEMRILPHTQAAVDAALGLF